MWQVFFSNQNSLPLAEFRLDLPSMRRADLPVLVSIRSILYELLATSESRCLRGLRYVQYSTVLLQQYLYMSLEIHRSVYSNKVRVSPELPVPINITRSVRLGLIVCLVQYHDCDTHNASLVIMQL